MKKIKLLSIAFLFVAGFVACEEDSDSLTGSENTGGIVKVDTELVGYVVGNGLATPYSAGFTVDQAPVSTSKVDIYKSFTDTKGTIATGDDEVSNEILLTSVTIPANSHASYSFDFTYTELIAGLTVGGNPLPASDGALNVGDSWTLRYAANTSSGEVHFNSGVTKVSVGTRFAGNYKVIEAEYYRIGVPRPDVAGPYIGTTVVIESVDATTYKVNNWFGPFPNNEWYFTIDANDVIDYPATRPDGSPQVANGIVMITCNTYPGEMTNVHCGSSNFVTRDDVTGKDKLTMSVGYLNAPGASREVYQVLEKIVD